MSTPNFKTLDWDLPLIVGGVGEDYDIRKKEFEESFDDEKYSSDIYEEEINTFCESLQDDLDDFNHKISHFRVSLKSGYYNGFQFDVEETDNYYNYETIKDIDDEDANYYYGMTAKDIKAEFESDLDKIRKLLESYKQSDPYLIELNCIGVFSNGEAIYKKA